MDYAIFQYKSTDSYTWHMYMITMEDKETKL